MRQALIPLSVLVAVAVGCSKGSVDPDSLTVTGGGGDPLGGIAVTISPTSATVPLGGPQLFVATVTGTENTAVSWLVSPQNCGTVTAGGLYTAPATTASCQVIVRSDENTDRSAAALVSVQDVTPPPPGDTAWESVKVGAGGFIIGLDVDPAGSTFVIRTDTYGAYVGNGLDRWRQLITDTTMPAAYLRTFTNGPTQVLGEGVYEIRVAPSNPDRLYMIFKRAIWRSDDRGASWLATSSAYSSGAIDPQSGTRYFGQKMAVDPANPDIVYAGGATGLWSTYNAGGTWTHVLSVPVPNATGITGITFDPTTSVTGVGTTTIYAVSNGNGVYRTIDGGVTWGLLPGSPTLATNAAIGRDGVYYVATRTGTISRYASGAWTTTAAMNTGGLVIHGVATDPFNPARIVAGFDSGTIAVSNDRGASWLTGAPLWGTARHPVRVATDIPWLANAIEDYMGASGWVFDPRVRDKLWFSQGIGMWYSTDPANTTTTTYRSHSLGIEQLVAWDVVAPPGTSTLLLAGSDRSIWVVPRANTSYPSMYVTMGSSRNLIAGHAVNYSRANSQHLVALVNRGMAGEPDISGYSLDGGASWTVFPTQPGLGGVCGDIVAPSIDNIIAVIGAQYAFRSTDRGTTWTRLTLPGDSGANNQNLHAGFMTCEKRVLAIDGVTTSTLYLYFYGHGVYRSVDGGATWTLVNTGAFGGSNMFWKVHLRSVPGQAGHLFLIAGQGGGQSSPNPQDNTALWRSTDGGTTWTTVPGVAEPYDVALGAPAPGQSYPAIYFAGWYNGVWGIWRSVNNTASWTQIGPFPDGNLDLIYTMHASQDTYGELYLATSGTGWFKGSLR